LNQLFQENPEIAPLIYKFMTSISKDENVDFKSFELAGRAWNLDFCKISSGIANSWP